MGGVLQLAAVYLTITIFPTFLLWFFTTQLRNANAKRRSDVLRSLGVPQTEKRVLVGLFHPYCNAGGGGERVLWTAVALLQRTSPEIVSVIYSGDGAAGKEEIIAKVKSRFNITLNPSSLHFEFLDSRHLVEDSTWPRFTLLGQSIGSMIVAWRALMNLIPDIYIDTMGYAFTFHVVRWLTWGRVPVGAYVHYPTISSEMLARVESRKRWHTNTDAISSSATLSRVKLIYYRFFMFLYSNALRRVSFLMVNSSWTKDHVDAILAHKDVQLQIVHDTLSLVLNPLFLLNIFGKRHVPPTSSQIVYPPCETDELIGFPLDEREKVILSVAQFRPEKDHIAQLYSFAKLVKQHPEYLSNPGKAVKLVLLGGARNGDDNARVESLRALADELGISGSVEFVVNASYPDMLLRLSRSSVGLSTMVDEHFGINVVEFMAAGLIPVTHASGGPLNDIVVPFRGEPTGFHATTPETFASALHTVFSLSPAEERAMRLRARAWAVERFSRKGFEDAWEASGWRRWLPPAYST